MDKFFDENGNLCTVSKALFSYMNCYMSGVIAHLTLLVNLKEQADADALEYANRMIVKRYPYLMLKRIKRGHRLFYVRNDADCPLLHKRGYSDICTEETNFHNISFSWWENEIRLSVNHGVTDGYGAMELIKTFLYYYFEKKNGVQPNLQETVRLADDDISIKEYENLMTQIMPNADKIDVSVYRKNKSKRGRILIPEKESSKKGAVSSEKQYWLKINEADFMSFCKENDAAPATALFMLLSEAIGNQHEESDVPIVLQLPVSFRKDFDNRITMQNSSSPVTLKLTKELRAKPYLQQGTALRGQLMIQTDPSYLAGVVKSDVKIYEIVDGLPFWWIKKLFAVLVESVLPSTASALITYPGQFKLGDISDQIDSVYFDIVGVMGLPVMTVCSASGNFCISYTQPANCCPYLEDMCKKLELLDVRYSLTDAKAFGSRNNIE